jgi:hypothetical protein
VGSKQQESHDKTDIDPRDAEQLSQGKGYVLLELEEFRDEDKVAMKQTGLVGWLSSILKTWERRDQVLDTSVCFIWHRGLAGWNERVISRCCWICEVRLLAFLLTDEQRAFSFATPNLRGVAGEPLRARISGSSGALGDEGLPTSKEWRGSL